MNADLRDVFAELKQLVEQPTTKITLQRLSETFDEATPARRARRPGADRLQLLELLVHLPPEHLTERDQVGYIAARRQARRSRRGARELVDRPAGAARLHPRSRARSRRRSPATPACRRTAAPYSPNRRRAAASSSRYELPILHGSPYRPDRPDRAPAPTARRARPATCSASCSSPARRPSNPGIASSDMPGIARADDALLQPGRHAHLRGHPRREQGAVRPGRAQAAPELRRRR